MKMWHEARKQEKKIRGMLVDYRKRAERRQNFYERIKADPTQFLQVHSRKCKIHLDQSVAAAAENPAIMMPWQGQKDNLIDRFDVRAHLDYIPPAPCVPKPDQTTTTTGTEDDLVDVEERAMNYERYRVLAQNEFLGISEEKFLHQLYLEEQYGVSAQVEAEQKAASSSKKKAAGAGVAIGYTYEDSTDPSGVVPFTQTISAIEQSTGSGRYDECMKSDSDSDLDMDVSIDINKVGTAQAHEMNACGRHYGMKSNDFYSFLTKDADEAEALKMAREEEQEKIMFSGRKSRRERRAQRERKFVGRTMSPPSYAAKEDLVPRTYDDPNDSSRSPSPVNSGKITYITSFGGEDELQPHSKISISFNKDSQSQAGTSYADKVRQNLQKLKGSQTKEEESKIPVQYQRRSRSYSDRSRSRSRSGSRSWRRRRSRSRSRGKRTYSKYRRRSRSGSGSSRSPSRSKGRRNRRSPDYSSRRRKPRSSSSSASPPKRPEKKVKSPESRVTTRSRSRSKSKKITLPVTNISKVKTEPLEKIPEHPLLSVPPPPPPSIPPIGSKTETVKKEATSPKVPILVEPEPEVPIRRYYGRKRDDQSSTDSNLSSDSSDEEDKKISISEMATMESSTILQSSEPGGNSSSTIAGGLIPFVGGITIKQERLESFGSGPTLPSSSSSRQVTSKSSQSIGPGSSAAAAATTTPTSGGIGGSLAASSGTTDSKSLAAAAASKSLNPRDRLKRKMQILLNKQFKADKKAEIEKVERQIQQQQEREDEMRELALRLRRRQRELRHKYGTPESDKSPSKSPVDSSDEERRETSRLSTIKEDSPAPKESPQLPPNPPSSSKPTGSSKSSYSTAAVIERKPVLRRITRAEASRSPSVARTTRRQVASRSRSRSRSSTVAGYGASTSASTGSRRYDDRSTRRRSPPHGSRYRHRSRSRSRERERGRYASGRSTRDYDRGGGGESSRHYRRRSRSASRERRRSRSRPRRSSRSRSRGYTGGGASGSATRRDRSPKPVKKLVDY
ncbi:CLK4-associating serine/arginine rich protein-like isoform X1 [Uranotaenia lowii]|uniref:CLK4-associating serine/arginine rich protein-like isoform X1 n=1 Tax=Uranotaenia lowii TaxID=190385 RepID=UPI002479065D|nr:CLK4-associating serine/arginine rich protein-like isoform X1 [Uranotaenia lowii]